MKSLFHLSLLLLVFATAAFAQNLIENGGFETGTLAPWTSEGSVIVVAFGSDHFCYVGTNEVGGGGGGIRQTVATTPGTQYYITFEQGATEDNHTNLAMQTLLLITPAGGTREAILDFETPDFDPGAHHSATFTATAEQTEIALAVVRGAVPIDDITMIELPASKFAGRYTGSAKTSTLVPLEDVTGTKSERLVATVSSVGRITIIRDGEKVDTAMLFNDGRFDLSVDGARAVGSATTRGAKIQLSTGPFSPTVVDEGRSFINVTRQIAFTLTRSRK